MIIESGSDCNIIDDLTISYLKQNKVVAENQIKNPSHSLLLQAGKKQELATFYVVKNGQRNLLGKKTAIKLGVLKVGIDIYEISTVFPIFEDILVDIPIDSSVNPIIQPYRRIPIPLEKRVNKKIQELISSDIIVPVNHPARFFSYSADIKTTTAKKS